jgi:glutaredoxin-related protein
LNLKIIEDFNCVNIFKEQKNAEEFLLSKNKYQAIDGYITSTVQRLYYIKDRYNHGFGKPLDVIKKCKPNKDYIFILSNKTYQARLKHFNINFTFNDLIKVVDNSKRDLHFNDTEIYYYNHLSEKIVLFTLK